MPIETVSSESGEIVELSDLKRELSLWDSQDDARAELLLSAARDYCERWSERTLRRSATRTYSTRDWPDRWTLKHPPVRSVTSITYYDTDNASQTLATSNYQTNITAEGFAHIEFTATATLPGLYDRQDAVTVTYTTGYADAASAPDAAKHAIILVAKALLNVGDMKLSERSERAATSLLSTVSAPSYA